MTTKMKKNQIKSKFRLKLVYHQLREGKFLKKIKPYLYPIMHTSFFPFVPSVQDLTLSSPINEKIVTLHLESSSYCEYF